MTSCTMAIHDLIAVILCLSTLGNHQALCTSCKSIQWERAYKGPYEIDFPRDCRSDSSQGCWIVTAYREGYVVQLSFNSVNISQDERTHACMEQIVVHDGKDADNAVLASFCGRSNPEIVTSKRHALIVFSSNSTHDRRGKFKVKYRALKDRSGDGDSYGLRFAFGGSIGAIALLVTCSGVFRRYKLSQRGHHTGFFLFGRSRVNAGTANGRGGDTRDSSRNAQQNRARQTNSRNDPERLTLRKRIAKFIQTTLRLKTAQNAEVRSTLATTHSSNSNEHIRRSRDRQNTLCPRSNSPASNGHLRFSLATCSSDALNNSASFNSGHDAFAYQDIPVSSFTSDPNAVRPPTYEDSVNLVNPLYLCQHGGGSGGGGGGGVHYNRAFNIKEEGGTYMFSPPPPYSEVSDIIMSEEITNTSMSYDLDLDHDHHADDTTPPAQEVTFEPVLNFRSVSSNVEMSGSTAADGDVCRSREEGQKMSAGQGGVTTNNTLGNLNDENPQEVPDGVKHAVKKEKDENCDNNRHEEGNDDCDGKLNKELRSASLMEITDVSGLSVTEGDIDMLDNEHASRHEYGGEATGNGDCKITGILVDPATPFPIPSHVKSAMCSHDNIIESRTLTSIPLDMMRRSGLKTSKSCSHTTSNNVTPVEEYTRFADVEARRDDDDVNDISFVINACASDDVGDRDTLSESMKQIHETETEEGNGGGDDENAKVTDA